MRRAFVIQLHQQSDPASFAGRVEHVDSGRSRRFRSLEELVSFIEQTLDEIEKQETEEVDPARAIRRGCSQSQPQ